MKIAIVRSVVAVGLLWALMLIALSAPVFCHPEDVVRLGAHFVAALLSSPAWQAVGLAAGFACWAALAVVAAWPARRSTGG